MVNHMTLQGRLVRDVELNTTASGTEVAKFTVAWSEKYRETETTCFLNCVAWRQTGAFVNTYFRKGQEIAVEGKLTTRSYEDKQGNKRTVTELVADKVHFCGSKSDNNGNQGNYSSPNINVQNDTKEPQPQQNNSSFSSSAVGFEEVEADGDLPF